MRASSTLPSCESGFLAGGRRRTSWMARRRTADPHQSRGAEFLDTIAAIERPLADAIAARSGADGHGERLKCSPPGYPAQPGWPPNAGGCTHPSTSTTPRVPLSRSFTTARRRYYDSGGPRP
jgi:hypothetical protein